MHRTGALSFSKLEALSCRVALTWSLVRSLRWDRPQLLLLDEPTHGLSSVNRQRLLGMLSTLAEDEEMALVLVTHRQDEIAQLGFENVLRLEERGAGAA